MGPINYSLNVQNPMQAFMESAQLGSGMAANQAQKAAAEQTAAAQKNKMLLDQWESRSKEQQSQDLQTGGQIIAAINSGSPEVAQQILAARAAAARNSGDEARAKGYETNAELIKINPQAAAATYQTMIATLPGGDKLVESLGKIGKDSREAALAPGEQEKQISEKEKSAADTARIKAETNRINAEVRKGGVPVIPADILKWNEYKRLLPINPEEAAQFAKAVGLVPNDKPLSVFNSQQIAKASENARNFSTDASKYELLAQQFRTQNVTGGFMNKWGNKLRELTGNEKSENELRNSVLAVVNSEGMKALPPGSATEFEGKIARQPFPTENASGEYVAKWLDAVAKVSAKAAEFEEHKADFIAKNVGQRDKSGGTIISTWKAKQEEQDAQAKDITTVKPDGVSDEEWARYKKDQGVK